MSPDDPRHASNAGYLEHILDREPACDACREAHATYRRNLWRKKYLRGVDRLYIDSTGTIRRIRALQAIGWRYSDMDQAVGHPGSNWTHNITSQRQVHLDTAKKVDDVFDQLCMKVGPSERNKRRAARNGWLPPLAWNDIDDPNEQPNLGGIDSEVDPVVVSRILGHDASLARTATNAERRAVVAAWPGSLNDLERLTGWRADRYIERPSEVA